ncbi:MAG: helix-turn-helix transcriptional regulator [Eubacterium sp.]|nr:helix-turn-helix transcriptional regulator [Eubacterium sp.]
MGKMNSDLLNTLMEQNDDSVRHTDPDDEFSFYHLVSTGNIEGLKSRGFSLMDKGLGVLSDDLARNVLYHFIISISMITRHCIDKGMPSEVAYTLSDLYIRKVDKLKKADEINRLHKTMVYDYAERMAQIAENDRYSIHVTKTIKYINDHITEPISVKDITENVKLNKSYLCALFKKETGKTIGSYIDTKKIELAKEYLTNTELRFIEISNALGFRSYSYYIQMFKKITGITPKEYRSIYYNRYIV